MSISLFKFINSFARKRKSLDMPGVFFAVYLPYLMLFYFVAYFILTDNMRLMVFPLLSGLFARFFINNLIYIFYKKQRPSALKETKVLIAVPKYPSFPSGHASFFFGVSFALFFNNPVIALCFIVLSCLMSVARVFCGVHWFRDILAGAVVGGLSSMLIYYLLKSWIFFSQFF